MTSGNSVNLTGGAGYVMWDGTYQVKPHIQTMPGCSNLGIAYSAGTFTVQGADGTALSSTNPAFIMMQSNSTSGQLKVFTITANQTFADSAGTSTISGNLFGMTAGVAVTVDTPFFLYAATDGTSITFGCSRVPHMQVAPAAGNIGKPTSSVADTQGSLFLFSNVTVANYAALPVICIGSFRMRMTVGNDWTVQTLSKTDGIGKFQESVIFDAPLGQFGANSGTYTIANGGTAAVFTSSNTSYSLNRTGSVTINFEVSGDGGTDGSGAVDAQFTIPYINAYANEGAIYSSVLLRVAGGNYLVGIAWYGPSVNYFVLSEDNVATARVLWSAFTNGVRSVGTTVTFLMSLA